MFIYFELWGVKLKADHACLGNTFNTLYLRPQEGEDKERFEKFVAERLKEHKFKDPYLGISPIRTKGEFIGIVDRMNRPLTMLLDSIKYLFGVKEFVIRDEKTEEKEQ